jgi:hypothetical protein
MSVALAGATGSGGDCSIPRICLRYSKARLNAIVSQLDPARRNAVEFRHANWWMRRFTALSVRQALSSALAAGHGFLMSLSGRLTKYTYAARTQALVSAFKGRAAGVDEQD